MDCLHEKIINLVPDKKRRKAESLLNRYGLAIAEQAKHCRDSNETWQYKTTCKKNPCLHSTRKRHEKSCPNYVEKHESSCESKPVCREVKTCVVKRSPKPVCDKGSQEKCADGGNTKADKESRAEDRTDCRPAPNERYCPSRFPGLEGDCEYLREELLSACAAAKLADELKRYKKKLKAEEKCVKMCRKCLKKRCCKGCCKKKCNRLGASHIIYCDKSRCDECLLLCDEMNGPCGSDELLRPARFTTVDCISPKECMKYLCHTPKCKQSRCEKKLRKEAIRRFCCEHNLDIGKCRKCQIKLVCFENERRKGSNNPWKLEESETRRRNQILENQKGEPYRSVNKKNSPILETDEKPPKSLFGMNLASLQDKLERGSEEECVPEIISKKTSIENVGCAKTDYFRYEKRAPDAVYMTSDSKENEFKKIQETVAMRANQMEFDRVTEREIRRLKIMLSDVQDEIKNIRDTLEDKKYEKSNKGVKKVRENLCHLKQDVEKVRDRFLKFADCNKLKKKNGNEDKSKRRRDIENLKTDITLLKTELDCLKKKLL